MEFKDINDFDSLKEYMNKDGRMNQLPVHLSVLVYIAAMQAYVAGRFVGAGCPEDRASWSLQQWEQQDKIDHENLQAGQEAR